MRKLIKFCHFFVYGFQLGDGGWNKAVLVYMFLRWKLIRVVHRQFSRLLPLPERVRIVFNGRALSIHISGDISFPQLFYEVFAIQDYRQDPAQPPACIVDAGAHHGVASLYFSCLYPDAQIYAFEPCSENFRRLKLNTEPFPNVHAYQAALSSHSGKARLYLHAASGEHSLLDQAGRYEEVETITLDDFMATRRIDRVDLLKIDVEGAEEEILTHSTALEKIDRIVGELHFEMMDWKRLKAVLERHFVVNDRIFEPNRAILTAVNRTLWAPSVARRTPQETVERPAILVTGATGFIGSHLAEFLRHSGQSVRCLVREDGLQNPISNKENFEWTYGDLTDPESLLKATEGCDLVFHLAACSRYNARLPEKEYIRVNVEGTRSLLEACRIQKVKRFVYISSIEAVGLSSDGQPLTEESEPHPRNIYGRSKLEAEHLVRDFHSRYGMECIIVRIGATYGPRERLMFERFFRPIRHGFYFLIGDGSALMEFGFVGNHVRGIWRVAQEGKPGETYFLSDARSYSYKEVVKEIAAQMGVDLRLISIPLPLAKAAAIACEGTSKIFRFYPFYVKETGRPPFSRGTLQWAAQSAIFCSTEKIKRELNYQPRYSLQEGLQETAHWYKEQGWL